MTDEECRVYPDRVEHSFGGVQAKDVPSSAPPLVCHCGLVGAIRLGDHVAIITQRAPQQT